MRIRIRIGQGPRIQRKEGKNRHLAAGVSALLTPAAVMAGILGVWRICADIGLTGPFAITSGLFSHWQVWLGVAAVLQVLSLALGRYGLKRRLPY